jgi:hypothetical protein
MRTIGPVSTSKADRPLRAGYGDARPAPRINAMPSAVDHERSLYGHFPRQDRALKAGCAAIQTNALASSCVETVELQQLRHGNNRIQDSHGKQPVRCRRSQSSASVLDFIAESCSKSVRLEAPPRSHSVRSRSDCLRRARTDRVLLTVRDTGFEGG